MGDFHLSFAVNKPMDVFGREWKNHVRKIEKYWKKYVKETDTAVITGDHSWGRNLEECREAGITAIVQTGIPDSKIIRLCDKYGIAVLCSEERHFKA